MQLLKAEMEHAKYCRALLKWQMLKFMINIWIILFRIQFFRHENLVTKMYLLNNWSGNLDKIFKVFSGYDKFKITNTYTYIIDLMYSEQYTLYIY